MKKKILIEGMTCVHCVNNVVMALKHIGAKNTDVNLDKSFATAEISEDITDEAIKLAIKDAGYYVLGIEKS
jgi:copper chaperone CopZ